MVRGYIGAFGLEGLPKTGKVCGIELPAGLQQRRAKLPQPIFTPATQSHSPDTRKSALPGRTLIGRPLAEKVRDVSIQFYKEVRTTRRKKHLIADTKFEFGLNDGNELVLIDEVLTADSSRFWPKDCIRLAFAAFNDKHTCAITRTSTGTRAAGAQAAADVIARTSEKYRASAGNAHGKPFLIGS